MPLGHKNVTFHITDSYSHNENDVVKGNFEVSASFFTVRSEVFQHNYPWNEGTVRMKKEHVIEKLKGEALRDLNAKVEAAFQALSKT